MCFAYYFKAHAYENINVSSNKVSKLDSFTLTRTELTEVFTQLHHDAL